MCYSCFDNLFVFERIEATHFSVLVFFRHSAMSYPISPIHLLSHLLILLGEVALS